MQLQLVVQHPSDAQLLYYGARIEDEKENSG